MRADVEKTLTVEQLGLYKRIQRVVYPYIVGSPDRKEMQTLSTDIDNLVGSLVDSAQTIPEGYELRWTISPDITAPPEPELVRIVAVDERTQERLPLGDFGESSAA